MSGETPMRGELVLMVLAGAVLGVVYNGMGLASRPPRGIPWVASKAELPSLEQMTPHDSVMTAPGVETPVPDAGRPSAEAGHSGPGAPPAGSTRTSGASSTGSAPAPAGPADPAPTSPATTGALPEPRRVAPLPFIPESDQPIQMQMATVKRFFDARAALFLDARDPAEYEKGHIPGAIRLTSPEAQNEPERMKALPVEGRPTIVYCEGGACEASLELARFLIDSGFKKVLVYMGGYPEWEAAGHPVERVSGR